MSKEFEETRQGTYRVPFTHIQYGAFVKRDGNWHFTAARYSPTVAREAAVQYYEDMNRHPQNKMDMDALNDIQIRMRTVTYGPWTSLDQQE